MSKEKKYCIMKMPVNLWGSRNKNYNHLLPGMTNANLKRVLDNSLPIIYSKIQNEWSTMTPK